MTSWVKSLNPNWYTYPSLRSVQALQFVLSLLIAQVAFDASSFSSGTYPVVHRTRWPDFFFHISFSAFHDFVTAGLQDRWSQKFGGRGGRTPLRIRVSTYPHTPKIRGEGWSNSTAYPRIHLPTHSKNSGGGVVELHCVSAYPLTHTLQKFGGRGGRTSLRIRVSTHQHTQKIRGRGGRTPPRIHSPTHSKNSGGGVVELHCVSAYPLTNTLKKFGGGVVELHRVSTHPHTPKIRGEGWSNFTAYPRIHSPTHSKNSGGGVVELHCVSAYPLTNTLKKFGGGVVELHRVSTHPHTPKIRGEGWSNFTAYPRIHSPTHSKNSGEGWSNSTAYPLTHTLQKFGGRGGRTSLRIRVSTHQHTQKIRGEGWSNSTAYPRIPRFLGVFQKVRGIL